MTELLPCPFCGGKNIEPLYIRGCCVTTQAESIVASGCLSCGAVGPHAVDFPSDEEEAEAARAWNTRHKETE